MSAPGLVRYTAPMDVEHLFAQLGISLAIGLLIGAERGWRDRELEEGRRIAGLRTFGLIGLAGGLAAVVATNITPWVAPAALLALTIILAAAFLRQSERTGVVGVTTIVAALTTFLLGALPVLGMGTVAAGAAVVTALLLGMKPRLHALLRRMEEADLMAVLRLLLISVVILPVLPDQGYGPGNALNPFEIWWMVVLIAAISFTGYLAIKILGPKRGVGLTAMLGGLVSSTAVTVSLSRLSGRHPGLSRGLGGGVVLASTAMFPRMAVIIAVVAPGVVGTVAVPLAAMTLAGGLGATFLLSGVKDADGEVPTPENPLQLSMALSFGVILAAVMLISHLLSERYGDAGLYAVAAISGVADVDAITLSASRMALNGITAEVAGRAIIIGALVNT
ncbi:MAG: MgtC/SapB family protein, partial [Alphaproteobacteria bacterium]